MAKRNSLCWKIINVLCYFRSCDPLVKVKLLRHYCRDYYGSVIWYLSHNSIYDICVAWRKGLRCIGLLSLPYNTHSRLISPVSVCDFLPVREELICRCASFIMKCLNSCNSVVHSVSRNGIYSMKMHSPIGAMFSFITVCHLTTFPMSAKG